MFQGFEFDAEVLSRLRARTIRTTVVGLSLECPVQPAARVAGSSRTALSRTLRLSFLLTPSESTTTQHVNMKRSV